MFFTGSLAKLRLKPMLGEAILDAVYLILDKTKDIPDAIQHPVSRIIKYLFAHDVIEYGCHNDGNLLRCHLTPITVQGA